MIHVLDFRYRPKADNQSLPATPSVSQAYEVSDSSQVSLPLFNIRIIVALLAGGALLRCSNFPGEI